MMSMMAARLGVLMILIPGVFLHSMHLRSRILAPRFQDMGERPLRIVDFAFPFNDLERSGRANVQAGAHPVTIEFPNKDGLVVFIKGQSALQTGCGAQSATVAEIPFNFDDFSFGHDLSPSGLEWSLSVSAFTKRDSLTEVNYPEYSGIGKA